jgi:hypothetical protein
LNKPACNHFMNYHLHVCSMFQTFESESNWVRQDLTMNCHWLK